MSIPCPHVAGSVSDFGDEHPEKYTATARQCRCIGTGSPTVADEAETHDEGSDVQRYEDEERRRPENSEGKE